MDIENENLHRATEKKMMGIDQDRNIPLPIKREVRKRCGFGCVICGIPLYEYDHMEDWSNVNEHMAANITLLCSKHHREKTNKLLSKQQVLHANLNPYNIINKTSTPYDFHFEGSNFEIHFGQTSWTMILDNVNPIRDFMIPILIDNVKQISFDLIENQLYFNLNIFDENGNLLLKVLQNQLEYTTEAWDIEFVGKNLKLREAKGKISFDIDFLIPNKVNINRAIFQFNGKQITIDGCEVKYKGAQIHSWGSYMINYRIGFALGEYDGKFPCVFRGK